MFGRFAMKPSLNPVIAVVALVFAYSLANTFLVESVYNWPGLGRYATDSIRSLDSPAILGVALFVAIAYVVLNLVVDVVQYLIVPTDRTEMTLLASPPGETIASVVIRTRWRRALRGQTLTIVGAVIAALLILVALGRTAARAVRPGGDRPPATHCSARPRHTGSAPIRWDRDVLSRTLYGARTSLGIAGSVLVIAMAIGLPLGTIAGYFGGWIDDVIMRITDVFLAFPALLLSLALASVLQASATTAAIVIAATWWPWYARLARGQAASIKGRGFVEASRALGVGHTRMIFRHILPNSATPVIVQASLDVGGIILTASTLSYLGLGAQDPTAEWGLMVSSGQSFFTTAWWLVTFPGAAILLASLGFNLLGDGLRTILDPRRDRR